MPLNGRNAAQLTTLSPGVLPAPNISSIDQGNTKTFPVVVLITVNGARTNQTNFMLDGGNNVDEYTNVNAPFPFPDALQEFRRLVIPTGHAHVKGIIAGRSCSRLGLP